MSWREWLLFAFLLVLGVIALARFIVARAPDADKLFAQIAPFQGFVGIAGLIFGVFSLLAYIADGGFAALVTLCSILLLIVLGAIIGWALLRGQLGARAASEGEALQSRLSGQLTKLGLGALAAAILLLIVSN